jgi:hypothetical protein
MGQFSVEKLGLSGSALSGNQQKGLGKKTPIDITWDTQTFPKPFC